MFQPGLGNWTIYRSKFGLSKCDEIDFHFGKRDQSMMSYDEAMGGVYEIVKASLENAQRNGRPYVMFIHGSSTSGPGRSTARSQVRGFMRSSAATPLIERKHCMQHNTVFVAKVRPLPDNK